MFLYQRNITLVLSAEIEIQLDSTLPLTVCTAATMVDFFTYDYSRHMMYAGEIYRIFSVSISPSNVMMLASTFKLHAVLPFCINNMNVYCSSFMLCLSVVYVYQCSCEFFFVIILTCAKQQEWKETTHLQHEIVVYIPLHHYAVSYYSIKKEINFIFLRQGIFALHLFIHIHNGSC